MSEYAADQDVKPHALAVGQRFFQLYDRMIAEGPDLPTVLRHAADVVGTDLNAQRATVYVIDEETRELVSAAVIGNVAQTIRIPVDARSLAGFCAAGGRAFVVPDAYGDLTAIDANLRFDASWDRLNRFRTRDVMCAPAVFADQVVGVVQAVNRKGRPFCPNDLPALESISRLVGYALHHARLYADLASMRQLEREKAQFMRLLVHELKSPVAAARMLADVLGSAGESHPQVAEVTGRITSRLDHMQQLISDLLELAKVKSGEPLGEITAVDLTAATAQAAAAHRADAESKGLRMSMELPANALVVRIDARGYELVVSNLLSNAIKYTPAGSVRLDLRGEGNWAVLTVADTGMGIPQGDVPKMFQEFFRASNARKGPVSGTGVGLAGAKRVVERFGGRMAFTSTEGEGTTFTVRLPLHGA